MPGINITVEIESGNGQSAQANTKVASPLVIKASRGGNPAPNQPVRFLVSEGGGKIGEPPAPLGDTLTTQTGPDGRATLPAWVLGPAGTQHVVARVGSPPLSSATFEATITPPLRVLHIESGNLQATYSGSPVDLPLVVRLSRGGAAIGGEPVTFRVSLGQGRIGALTNTPLTPVVVDTDPNGLATLEHWWLGVPGNQAVVASVGPPEPSIVRFVAKALKNPKFPT
jgi:hypothetical protein